MRRLLSPNIKTYEQYQDFRALLSKTLGGQGVIDINDNDTDETIMYAVIKELKAMTVGDEPGVGIEILEEFIYIPVEPVNFTYNLMLDIHDKARKMFVEDGTYGIKFESQIRSIINRVDDEFFGKTMHETIIKRAAFYWYEIATHQAFHNGNKRTALLAMLSYLKLNNYKLLTNNLSDSKLYNYTVQIAEGSLSIDAIEKMIYNNVSIDINKMNEKEKK